MRFRKLFGYLAEFHSNQDEAPFFQPGDDFTDQGALHTIRFNKH
jgi:hypothetical protein